MLLYVDTLSTVALYEQIRNQIVIGIASGNLAVGESLPSVRRLAADLSINLHTVNKAYQMLADEGYVLMDRRKGAIIASNQQRNDQFDAFLHQKLSLIAAEGICHDMDEHAFLTMCKKGYDAVMKGNDAYE